MSCACKEQTSTWRHSFWYEIPPPFLLVSTGPGKKFVFLKNPRFKYHTGIGIQDVLETQFFLSVQFTWTRKKRWRNRTPLILTLYINCLVYYTAKNIIPNIWRSIACVICKVSQILKTMTLVMEWFVNYANRHFGCSYECRWRGNLTFCCWR